jgi:hypothetical protein
VLDYKENNAAWSRANIVCAKIWELAKKFGRAGSGSGKDKYDRRRLRSRCNGRRSRRWDRWDFGEHEGKSGDWQFIMDGRGAESLRNRSNRRELFKGDTYDGIK